MTLDFRLHEILTRISGARSDLIKETQRYAQKPSLRPEVMGKLNDARYALLTAGYDLETALEELKKRD